ncbi:DUF4383 domain-containing protein [Streptomyces sp. CBMA29]|uniref:DUF4383 domain-containing protein n=1 Tax=Streptomyces sp. CBMA29 TaxID=1896314 RepID=UPI001661FA53|nr:DUF4383 domain-containing protein [Streptomyces sp. CBMA29]MBD0739641.1 DUF4383 domain-containing protein [Streptomyces sp. CBMA29]
MRLDDHLPVDHKLSQMYRFGAGLMGLILVVFGILGLLNGVSFLSKAGSRIAGLNSNGALSTISIVIGVLLFAGMVKGGNFASTLNIVVGVAFLLSGFVNLALLDTGSNLLAFKMSNVLFSFAVGVMLMFFGMYGRVTGGLPHDNPYWRKRHPQQAAREEEARAAVTTRRPPPRGLPQH